MKKKLTTIILLTIFFFMTGCQKRNEKATDENSQNVTTQLNTPDKDVRTIKIEPRDFNYELISNGKLTASQYADLVFPNSGLIKTIFVKNGDHVVKGQVIRGIALAYQYVLKFKFGLLHVYISLF